VAPLDAARAAAALGLKVFTVLVGRGGSVPYPVDEDSTGHPVYRDVELPVNAGLLREIARVTGAAHYDAVDREGLSRGLHAILDGLERTRLEGARPALVRAELAPWLLLPAFALAALAVALGATALRTFP
jgi:Ca-activated chloride channel family protein